MRKSASSSSSRIAKLNKGVSVTILDASGSYYKISYDGKEGYVSSQYVQLSSGSNANTNNNTAATGTGVTTGNINFRTGPSTSYSKVSGCSKVPKNASVEILGESNGWYQVRYNGYTGYLSADYVKVSSGSNSNNNSNNNSLNPVTPGNNGADTIGARRYAQVHRNDVRPLGYHSGCRHEHQCLYLLQRGGQQGQLPAITSTIPRRTTFTP